MSFHLSDACGVLEIYTCFNINCFLGESLQYVIASEFSIIWISILLIKDNEQSKAWHVCRNVKTVLLFGSRRHNTNLKYLVWQRPSLDNNENNLIIWNQEQCLYWCFSDKPIIVPVVSCWSAMSISCNYSCYRFANHSVYYTWWYMCLKNLMLRDI